MIKMPSSWFSLVLILVLTTVRSNVDIVRSNPVPLGDPFILLHDDQYYAYGTNAENGIEVYTSHDLKSWEKKGLALDKKDSWGDKWFWAPEVYYIPEKEVFFMCYSADEHINVATSDSPLGPFVQDEKRPMLEDKAIDNTLFLDNGKPYLFFDKFDDGLSIWVAELKDDLKTIKDGSLKEVLSTSQEWEKVWPKVNEGPFVVKHKDIYYLTYSANSYESPYYGVGYATAETPMGPWEKSDSNPVLQRPMDLVGVGHNHVFKDKNDALRIVFHAHHDKDNIHPRAMYISDVNFTNDSIPQMKVDTTKIIQAELVE